MTYQFSFPCYALPAALRGGVLALGLMAAVGRAVAATGEAAAADAAAAPAWKFSGFGTLGAVYASVRNADFSSTILRANGAGRSEAWSPDVDSRLGA
ncbi:hypothetical protein [Massilia alkalitolerans]|uniref:hypothetical protein n=1 Tax=Massilia alkalitolerans TaxID=286638 RepID=UPI0028B0A38E|nr:hypothetical protein [Massilia alkalitolerans]